MDKNELLVDIEKKIKNDFQSVANSFVSIGYYLKQVRDEKLYLDAGYETLWHYAEDKFRMSASKASRFMSINDKFSVDGNSPLLLVKYDGFSYSQLQEMLPMNDEQLSEVDPDMTVTEIRDMKKPKEEENPSEQGPEEEPNPPELNVTFEDDEKPQSESEDDNHISLEIDMSEDDQEDDIEEDAISHEKEIEKDEVLRLLSESICKMHRAVLERDNYNMDIIRDRINVSHGFGFGDDGMHHALYSADVEHSKIKVETLDEDAEYICAFEIEYVAQYIYNHQGRNYWYGDLGENECISTSQQQQPRSIWDEYKERHSVTKPIETVIKEPETVSTHFCEAFGYDCNLEYRREIAKTLVPECTASCCCKCDYANMCGAACNVAEHKKESEVVAEVEYHEIPEQCKTDKIKILLNREIEKETQMIEQMKDTWKDKQPDTLLKHQTLLNAYKGYLVGIIYPVPKSDTDSVNPVEQPPLWKLKNNDERKAWIESYHEWPVWSDQPLTGEKFYRYDFEDGISFVIKDSLSHKWIGGKYSKDEEYSLEAYYILGQKPTEDYRPKKPTFRESACNMSQLVEHLKNIQRS